MKAFYQDLKVGILGGGQLGRMLLQAGTSLNISFHILDNDPYAPCSNLTPNFTKGDLQDYETVLRFGENMDVITIEIEKVNTEALEHLEKRGKKVFPQPHIIRMIQDKRVQKQFYKDNGIPTSDFILIEGKEDLKNHIDYLPAVQKSGKDGYDGKGVQVLRSAADIEKGLESPGLLEKMVDIDKEISIIAARNEDGQVKLFPPVELVYHEQNMVDYLLAPAIISDQHLEEANAIATKLVEKLDFVGLLAVEMFVDKSGQVLVNEVAPRPHNSGHQTIEGNITSQYEQTIRAVLNLPLGDTGIKAHSGMLNLLGAEGFEGFAVYENIEEGLAMSGVNFHIYGKRITKPHRKMGHITITAESREEVVEKIQKLKKLVRVIA